MSKQKEIIGEVVVSIVLIILIIVGAVASISMLCNWIYTYQHPAEQVISIKQETTNKESVKEVIKVGQYKYIQFFPQDYSSDKILFANLDKKETVKQKDGSLLSRYVVTAQLMENEYVEPVDVSETWLTDSDFKKVFQEITDKNESSSFLCNDYPNDNLHTDVSIMVSLPVKDDDDDQLVKTSDGKILLMDTGCERVELIK